MSQCDSALHGRYDLPHIRVEGNIFNIEAAKTQSFVIKNTSGRGMDEDSDARIFDLVRVGTRVTLQGIGHTVRRATEGPGLTDTVDEHTVIVSKDEGALFRPHFPDDLRGVDSIGQFATYGHCCREDAFGRHGDAHQFRLRDNSHVIEVENFGVITHALVYDTESLIASRGVQLVADTR